MINANHLILFQPEGLITYAQHITTLPYPRIFRPSSVPVKYLLNRVRPRFFDQVGHESMYASSGNKHFFIKSCHHQTYQNYE